MSLRAVIVLCVIHASVCHAQCPPPGTIPGDADQDGEVQFDDFVALANNFNLPGGWAQGDFNCDGQVDFDDFVILANNFGGVAIDTEAQLDSTTFQANKEYWIFTSALDNKTTPLNITNVFNPVGQKTVICFADLPNNPATLEAFVTFSLGANPNKGYGDNYGVVNVVNCTNVELRAFNVQNLKVYDPSDNTFRGQSSCALNISNSTVDVLDANLTGNGKSVVLIHNQSNVTIKDTNINGYYFELNIGASNVTVENSALNQNNIAVGDSHAAINASASYSLSNGGPASSDPTIQLTNVTFNMMTGRAILRRKYVVSDGLDIHSFTVQP